MSNGDAKNPKMEWVILTPKEVKGETQYLQTGPYSHHFIKEKLYSGEISFDHFAWKDGMKEWRRIGDISDFSVEKTVSPPADDQSNLETVIGDPFDVGGTSLFSEDEPSESQEMSIDFSAAMAVNAEHFSAEEMPTNVTHSEFPKTIPSISFSDGIINGAQVNEPPPPEADGIDQTLDSPLPLSSYDFCSLDEKPDSSQSNNLKKTNPSKTKSKSRGRPQKKKKLSVKKDESFERPTSKRPRSGFSALLATVYSLAILMLAIWFFKEKLIVWMDGEQIHPDDIVTYQIDSVDEGVEALNERENVETIERRPAGEAKLSIIALNMEGSESVLTFTGISRSDKVLFVDIYGPANHVLGVPAYNKTFKMKINSSEVPSLTLWQNGVPYGQLFVRARAGQKNKNLKVFHGKNNEEMKRKLAAKRKEYALTYFEEKKELFLASQKLYAMVESIHRKLSYGRRPSANREIAGIVGNFEKYLPTEDRTKFHRLGFPLKWGQLKSLHSSVETTLASQKDDKEKKVELQSLLSRVRKERKKISQLSLWR